MHSQPREPIHQIQLDGRTVSLFPPASELWNDLHELRYKDIGGDPRDTTPWGLRAPMVSRSMLILAAVARHCSDSNFSGLPGGLVLLVRAILQTWDDPRDGIISFWRAFVQEYLDWFQKHLEEVDRVFSLMQDPSPELIEQFRTVGRAAARSSLQPPICPPPEQPTAEPFRPRWDWDKQELWFTDRLCRPFKGPAPDQFAIFEAFEKQSWPRRIRSPIPRAKLKRTLSNMRKDLTPDCPIQFTADRRGGIEWRQQPTT